MLTTPCAHPVAGPAGAGAGIHFPPPTKSILRSCITRCACAFVLLVALPLSSQAIPSDVSELIQQSKYPEALARVYVLLKDSPNDEELKKIKTDIEGQLKQVEVKASAPVTTAEPKLTGEDKLTLITLNEIIEEIDKTTEDAAKRIKLLNEFLSQSEPFVARYPDFTNLWVARAMAATEIGNVEIGWKSGQQLKRLKVLDGEDAKALKAMSALKRKGWLAEALVDAQVFTSNKQRQEMMDRLTPEQKMLIGKWVVKKFYTYGANTFKQSGVLEINLSANGSLRLHSEASGSARYSDNSIASFTVSVKSCPLPMSFRESVDPIKIPAVWKMDNNEYPNQTGYVRLQSEEIVITDRADVSDPAYAFTYVKENQ